MLLCPDDVCRATRSCCHGGQRACPVCDGLGCGREESDVPDFDDWNPRPDDHLAPRLNVVVGTNGSGKTVLLQALFAWFAGGPHPARLPRVDGIAVASVTPRDALYLRASSSDVWVAESGRVWTKGDDLSAFGLNVRSDRYLERLGESLEWCKKRNAALLIDHLERELDPLTHRSLLTWMLGVAQLEAPIIVTTQAPLVLASTEPHWQEERDALWCCAFDPVEKCVHVMPERYCKQGTSDNWLVSGLFNKKFVRRCPKANQAIQSALDEIWARRVPSSEVRSRLQEALPSTDPFWARWRAYAKTKGVDV